MDNEKKFSKNCSSSNIEEEIEVLLQISAVAKRMARDLEIYEAVKKNSKEK